MNKKFTDFLKAIKNAEVGKPSGSESVNSFFSGMRPDESLFWNVENTDNAGFIIPIKRYSDIGELYLASDSLINAQREFLRNITSCGGTDKTEKEKYYPADKEIFFGCDNMKELYDYYLTVFEGKIGFDGFCEVFEGYLKDENGALSVKRSVTENVPLFCGEEWKSRVVLIYDVIGKYASIMAALPDTEDGREITEEELTYRFSAMKMIKTERGWRLTDSSLFVY